MKIAGMIFTFIVRVIKKTMRDYNRTLFAQIGKNSIIDGGIFTYKNIYIGDNVYIGEQAYFLTANARIYIGDYVMMGPKVTIVTGDHRTDKIGEYMINVKDKVQSNDIDVIIEKDCWIGMNATILKGVTIGRGSVIAASSIVLKDVEPYTIYICKTKQYKRFTSKEIFEHELVLDKNRNQD